MLEHRPLALETNMGPSPRPREMRHGSVKRVASAAGKGSIVAQLVHSLLAAERSAPPTGDGAATVASAESR